MINVFLISEPFRFSVFSIIASFFGSIIGSYNFVSFETFIAVIADKEIPGFGELFRELSYKTIGTSAMQSRACAALANGKYIFALPGSSGGVIDAWDKILKFQVVTNYQKKQFGLTKLYLNRN